MTNLNSGYTNGGNSADIFAAFIPSGLKVLTTAVTRRSEKTVLKNNKHSNEISLAQAPQQPWKVVLKNASQYRGGQLVHLPGPLANPVRQNCISFLFSFRL